MRAAVVTRYGSPDVIQIRDVEKPSPKDNEVLIKVRAASVNPLDLTGMSGTPYFARLMGGLRKPKDTRLGTDVAGQVEAVGKNVARFKPGDEVFGLCRGSFAEYACTSETASFMSALAVKPERVTFEQAAAAPVAGLTALQGLRDKGNIQAGLKVLINGAAGGVGTFAVQVAKSYGADVTGVCSTRNVDMLRSLGADRVIDYTQEDFSKSGQRYDVLFDCIGNHSLRACRRVLNPGGRYVLIGAEHGRWISPVDSLIKALVVSCFVKDVVPLMAKGNNEDLAMLGEIIETGKVTPAIEKCYRLGEISEALRHLEGGHARGKIVIIVD